MFARNGVPIAGAMGDMGDMKAENPWTVYRATDNIVKTLELGEANGGQVVAPAMPIGESGTQAVLVDPTGARLGAWQPQEFPGFTTLDEAGAPNWFQLTTTDCARAVDFYRTVFRCETNTAGDTEDFRYTTLRSPAGNDDVAGIMDASRSVPPVTSSWSVYSQVDDVDATGAKALQLGGHLLHRPEATPYGHLATLADPSRAQFKLRARN